jgi:SAM-dependent methyltransferase
MNSYPALFDQMYREKRWGDGIKYPLSGPGSTILNSAPVLSWIRDLSPSSIVDIGCGDMTWMSNALLEHPFNYVGIDVSSLALSLAQQKVPNRAVFVHGDLTSRTFSVSADLIIVKDVLFHLTDDMVLAALAQLAKCRFRHLILNTDSHINEFPRGSVREMNRAHWCGANLEKSPFAQALLRCGNIIDRKTRPQHGEYLLISHHA